MSFKILEDCTNCAACEEECPREAIAAGDDIFVIDPAACDDCTGLPAPLCVAACPIDGCIVPVASGPRVALPDPEVRP
jgi:ferredoxin